MNRAQRRASASRAPRAKRPKPMTGPMALERIRDLTTPLTTEGHRHVVQFLAVGYVAAGLRLLDQKEARDVVAILARSIGGSITWEGEST